MIFTLVLQLGLAGEELEAELTEELLLVLMLADMIPVSIRTEEALATNIADKLRLASVLGLDVTGQGGEGLGPIDAVAAVFDSWLVAAASNRTDDLAESVLQMIREVINLVKTFATARTGQSNLVFFVAQI